VSIVRKQEIESQKPHTEQNSYGFDCFSDEGVEKPLNAAWDQDGYMATALLFDQLLQLDNAR